MLAYILCCTMFQRPTKSGSKKRRERQERGTKGRQYVTQFFTRKGPTDPSLGSAALSPHKAEPEPEPAFLPTEGDEDAPPECVDQPDLANCDLIVYARLCSNSYYSSFCCASCTRHSLRKRMGERLW
ncbi:papilin-like [Gymnodraco acuticeps]|uniref:Papilin-like n=1 Tax=Gymnodraco acuticeps TaxID=8218 RepID=A0A6P8W6R6_GYMAC|nr:papilin-like [Gymnodraco acuticeps]